MSLKLKPSLVEGKKNSQYISNCFRHFNLLMFTLTMFIFLIS